MAVSDLHDRCQRSAGRERTLDSPRLGFLMEKGIRGRGGLRRATTGNHRQPLHTQRLLSYRSYTRDACSPWLLAEEHRLALERHAEEHHRDQGPAGKSCYLVALLPESY